MGEGDGEPLCVGGGGGGKKIKEGPENSNSKTLQFSCSEALGRAADIPADWVVAVIIGGKETWKGLSLPLILQLFHGVQSCLFVRPIMRLLAGCNDELEQPYSLENCTWDVSYVYTLINMHS